MPAQTGKPLPPEGREALEEQLEKESTPANTELFPAKPGTQEFALSAKLRFEEHLATFKKEMGEEIFDKQCGVAFVTVYDRGTGSIAAVDGNVNSLLMLMGIVVHRLAEAIQKAQQFMPKRDSYHRTIIGICNRLTQLALAMMPDGADTEPGPAPKPVIDIIS